MRRVVLVVPSLLERESVCATATVYHHKSPSFFSFHIPACTCSKCTQSRATCRSRAFLPPKEPNRARARTRTNAMPLAIATCPLVNPKPEQSKSQSRTTTHHELDMSTSTSTGDTTPPIRSSTLAPPSTPPITPSNSFSASMTAAAAARARASSFYSSRSRRINQSALYMTLSCVVAFIAIWSYVLFVLAPSEQPIRTEGELQTIVDLSLRHSVTYSSYVAHTHAHTAIIIDMAISPH